MTARSVDDAAGSGAARAQPGTCSFCGMTVEDLPATWSLSVSARGAQRLCERCTREHLRSIEGNLDEAWW